MDLTEELLRQTALKVLDTAKFPFGEHEIDFETPFRRISILDAIRTTLNVDEDLHWHWGMERESDRESIIAAVPDSVRAEVLGDDPNRKSCDSLLVDLFEACVEHTLIQPTFVCDYPKSKCPLTKSAADDPNLAERFELFIAGMEMANAYSELNDPAEQYEMFRQQVEQKAQGDDEAQPMDLDYVRALEYGMPPASGLGIGIDRLVMLLTNQTSIREVILFPTMRPVTEQEERAAAEELSSEETEA